MCLEFAFNETDTIVFKACSSSQSDRHGLLASGGGKNDGNIHFWNTLNENRKPVESVDTESQICNLIWSKNAPKLVSTHGFSRILENYGADPIASHKIIVWKYEDSALKKITTVYGNSYRPLYSALSPDGESIVTGDSDEQLRFWKVFSEARILNKERALNRFANIR